MTNLDDFGDQIQSDIPLEISEQDFRDIGQEQALHEINEPSFYAKMNAKVEAEKAENSMQELNKRLIINEGKPNGKKVNSVDLNHGANEISEQLKIVGEIDEKNRRVVTDIETEVDREIEQNDELKKLESKLKEVQKEEAETNPAENVLKKSEAIQKEMNRIKGAKREEVYKEKMETKKKELTTLYSNDVIPDTPDLSEKEKVSKELLEERIGEWEYQDLPGIKGAPAMYREYMVEVQLRGEEKPEAIQKFKEKLKLVLGEEFEKDHDKIIHCIKEHVVDGEMHLTLMRAQAIAKVDAQNGTNFSEKIAEEAKKENGNTAVVMQQIFDEIQERAELPENDPLRLKIDPDLMKLLVSLFVVVVGKKIYNSLFQRDKAIDSHVEHEKELAKLAVVIVGSALVIKAITSMSEEDKATAQDIIQKTEQNGGKEVIVAMAFSEMRIEGNRLYGEINGEHVCVDDGGTVYLIDKIGMEYKMPTPDAAGFDGTLEESIARKLGARNILENKRTQVIMNHLARFAATDTQFATKTEAGHLATVLDIVTGPDSGDSLQALKKTGLLNPEQKYVTYLSLWLDKHKMLLSQTGDMAEKEITPKVLENLRLHWERIKDPEQKMDITDVNRFPTIEYLKNWNPNERATV